MRQAVLTKPEHIVFQDVPAPKAEDLGPHEVLLKIKRIGICGSEIHSWHGKHPATFYPVIQGHEYSGIVEAVGTDVTVCAPGDSVTARPQLVCGECNPCKRGQYNVCEHLRVQAFQADGAARDYFVVDDDRIVKLPEGMSLDYGAMIEPSAVGAHSTARAGDLRGKNVVVSANYFGKTATVCFISSLILSFFHRELSDWGYPVHLWLLWISVALAILAMTVYTVQALGQIRKIRDSQNS